MRHVLSSPLLVITDKFYNSVTEHSVTSGVKVGAGLVP